MFGAYNPQLIHCSIRNEEKERERSHKVTMEEISVQKLEIEKKYELEKEKEKNRYEAQMQELLIEDKKLEVQKLTLMAFHKGRTV